MIASEEILCDECFITRWKAEPFAATPAWSIIRERDKISDKLYSALSSSGTVGTFKTKDGLVMEVQVLE